MYRLMTKESRQEARKAYINGRTTEVYKDIEILIYDRETHKVLMIWKGNAGKPYLHYSFKNDSAYLDRYISQEKKRADEREAYKIEESKKEKPLTGAAATAKLIKNILKKQYPTVKFSVRSDNFAGGNSVDVDWTDGIPAKELDSFLRQFEYGSFDGMTDSYNYDNHRNHPQVKYVMPHRDISKDKEVLICKQLAEFMGIENSMNATIPHDYMANVRGYAYDCALSALVYQITVNFDFTKGFTGVRYQKYEGVDVKNMFELY
jgi:hypothetical protein